MDFIKLTDTGLVIASRNEIYDQLVLFARAAYGDDISLDEGSSFDTFLQMVADSLAMLNGSVQSFSELLSTKELSGNFLDFVAGQRGIIRKVKSNQKVLMTATVDSEIVKPFLAARGTIFVKDVKERTWVNTAQLLIHAYKFLPDGSFDTADNFQGTCEFGLMPLNGYDTDLLYANNFPLMTPLEVIAPSAPEFIDHFTFINRMNATPAVAATEIDAQLRSRYDRAAYSNAIAAIEGVRSNLLKFANYVRIIENITSSSEVSTSNPYGLDAHSIWCIVDGGSTSRNWKPFIAVSTALPDASSFNYAGIQIGDFIRVTAEDIFIMGSLTREINSIWERTGESELTERSEDYLVSTDALDISIAQAIFNYKSLGCGVSVMNSVPNGTTLGSDGEVLTTGNFLVEFPVETMTAQIRFTRLVENEVTFAVELVVSGVLALDEVLRDMVRERVSFALQQYVASMEPGEVVTSSASISAINSVLSQYDKGMFDFVSCVPSYSIAGGIAIYQRATGGTAVVVFSDE